LSPGEKDPSLESLRKNQADTLENTMPLTLSERH